MLNADVPLQDKATIEMESMEAGFIARILKPGGSQASPGGAGVGDGHRLWTGSGPGGARLRGCEAGPRDCRQRASSARQIR